MSADELTVLRRRFVVLTFVRWFPAGLQVPVLVLLISARGLDVQAIGAVFLAYGLTCAVLELPSGGLADVIGRRAVLLVSGLLSIAGAAGLAFAQGFATLVAAAVIGGAARALDSGPLEAWYVDTARTLDPDCDLGPALSRSAAAGALAIGTGALAGGALVALSPLPTAGAAPLLSLSLPYLVSASLGVLALLLVIRWVQEPERPHRASLRAVLRDVPRTIARGTALVTRDGVLRRLSARVAVVGVVLVTCELLGPLQFEETIGASAYAVVVALAFLGTAVGARLAPVLSRVLRGTWPALLVATILAAVFLAGLALPTWWLPAVAYVLLYAALGLDDPLVGQLLHDQTASSERSTVLSTQSLLMQGGGAAANLTLPLLLAATSFDVAWLGVAAVLLAASLLAVGLPRQPGLSVRTTTEARPLVP